MKRLADILDSVEFVAGFGMVRATEPRPLPELPSAEGLDVIHHGNTDIDQSMWAYAEPPVPPVRP